MLFIEALHHKADSYPGTDHLDSADPSGTETSQAEDAGVEDPEQEGKETIFAIAACFPCANYTAGVAGNENGSGRKGREAGCVSQIFAVTAGYGLSDPDRLWPI